MLKSLISPIAVGGDVGGQVQGGGDQDGAAGGGVRRAEGRAGHGPQAAPRRLRDQDEAHRRPRGTVEKGEDIRPPLAEGGGFTHLCLRFHIILINVHNNFKHIIRIIH